MMRAKKVRFDEAGATIMPPRMSPLAEGWRAMPSMAEAASYRFRCRLR